MASVISGDANVSATEFGYLDGVTSALQTQMDAKLPLAGGKILQIVRATDSTLRSTTSTSFVDTNLSVTITPEKSDSAILLIATYRITTGNTTNNDFYGGIQIADSSNNGISGSNGQTFGQRGFTSTGTTNSWHNIVLIGYSTPATTAATTYKTRFFSGDANCTITLQNGNQAAQLYAIEVSA